MDHDRYNCNCKSNHKEIDEIVEESKKKENILDSGIDRLYEIMKEKKELRKEYDDVNSNLTRKLYILDKIKDLHNEANAIVKIAGDIMGVPFPKLKIGM